MNVKWAARAAIVGAAALAGLSGCSAAGQPVPPSPSPSVAISVAVPDGGVTLRDLGYTNAPDGFSVPNDVEITDRVDAHNNVTAVFSAPAGIEIAGYLRDHLPAMGFEVTADKNQSLLFNNGTWDGAFTTSGSTAALSLRTDR